MRRALLTVTALLALSPAALAAEPRLSLPDVEDEVMCVTCNIPLNLAQNPQADRQRAFIQRLIDEGRTKQEIKTRLVAEYGENVLALPDERGIGLAAYAVPIALVLALLAALAVVVPRWRHRGPPVTAGGFAATDAELDRLDDDLSRYD